MSEYIDSEQRLVAILRGIKPEETSEIVDTLIDTGFRAIEIPLNSPDPLQSIEIAAKLAAEQCPDCLIGAGTVLSVDEVRAVHAVGGRLIVSPNVDAEVIAESVALGMTSLPGVFSPTEAFTALKAGASGLKFFPASQLGAAGIKAISAVLPAGTEMYAVGGVDPEHFAEYAAAGVRGFGLGSCLYRAGTDALQVRIAAQHAIKALSGIKG